MAVPMIQRETMFEPLLAADPSFQPRWEEFLADWSDEPDLPHFLALSSLAEHLLKRLKDRDTEGFDRIFAVVERWHTEGDAYVREAASIGFLESLQNQSGGTGRRPTTVELWLGPESKRWRQTLDRFWEGDEKALRLDT
jgi:hypothetical protein